MTNETKNWPDLAIGLFERLTGRNAEISYQFDDFELHVPSSTADDAEHAQWKMNGTLKITTTEK
ncbi:MULTISPECIES: hypothetical protein [Phaeodactylibacter]|jgi:hypothetical protein|uniref:Uncharacterized protein n=1 Tax=Phaeodactylibacter xiamenensis TaxID=1524460 RepID=A0A098SAU2_9BACT|nr:MULTISPECIES: hypothetical protein [Phaeodactylibacter]MCR9051390.1 hypothetical protein [bacterium]KGE89235.1 hypothetical protein IX84_05665 [Phaeodactylibacter xiamenensis]MCI4649198.1 hypothetical protein [Phaeodactylibacter sp.]MCI5090337.1 hypothetical protein [Phaeodactylibacter sp.]MCR9099711.1 hypothetical protein [bacterium]